MGSWIEGDETGVEESFVLRVVEDEIGEEDEIELLLRSCRVGIDRS